MLLTLTLDTMNDTLCVSGGAGPEGKVTAAAVGSEPYNKFTDLVEGCSAMTSANLLRTFARMKTEREFKKQTPAPFGKSTPLPLSPAATPAPTGPSAFEKKDGLTPDPIPVAEDREKTQADIASFFGKVL